MEAMACGCPLVLSDIPAHKEIADERSALFVDPKNVLQIGNSILDTLSNSDKAKTRAEHSLQRSKEWSITKMASEYEHVYNECIQSP
jgi:glycosyltransferase involved in cell wall biosynthesis